MFSLKINHGGVLTSCPNRRYKGGNVNWFDNIDADEFSIVEVNEMLKVLGYEVNGSAFHYKKPNCDLDSGLKPFAIDSDVLDLINYVDKHKVMELYIEHPVSKPISSKGDNEFDPLFSYPNPNTEKVESSKGLGGSDNDASESEGEESGSEDGEYSDNDSEDSEFIVDNEHIIDDVEVDMEEFKRNTDNDVEWLGCNEAEEENSVELVDEDVDLEGFESVSDADDEEAERERALKKLRKESVVDEMEGKVNFFVGRKFGNKEMIKEMVTKLSVETRRELHLVRNDKQRVRAICRGQVPVFTTESQNMFKDSGLKDVSGLEETSGLKDSSGPSTCSSVAGKRKKPKPSGYVKKKASVNKEKSGCPWILHCTKKKGELTWEVRTFKDTHNCLQSRTVKKCTATFLAKDVEETIKPNPKIPLAALKDQLQKKYELGVSKMKVYRAKQIAKDKVVGDHTKQFASLRDYLTELASNNRGTTIKLDLKRDCDVNSQTRQFKRVYICLGPLKQGFRAGGRDLLGLDGCFLSGPFPGQILTAVGVDPNNGTYPLAYAVVESETKASWTWFLECLGDDLELYRNSNFTFITDRQKVILNT